MGGFLEGPIRMETKHKSPLGQLWLALLVACTMPCAVYPEESPADVIAAAVQKNADIEVISESEIEERDGIVYRIGMSEPFTGKVVSNYYSGQKMSETNFTNGKKDGKALSWYSNGVMRMDSSYRNGERDGLWTKWDEDGHIQFQRQYQNGARLR